jgi:hypothetical protein
MTHINESKRGALVIDCGSSSQQGRLVMAFVSSRLARLGTAIALVAVVGLAFGARTPAWAAEPGQVFATPDEAAKALIAAVLKGDDAAIAAVLGTEPGEILKPTTDPGEKQRREAFIVKAKQGVSTEAQEDGTVEVVVGNDRWPLPIPLVKGEAGWRFDIEAGRKEILARVIGANELGAIALLGDAVAAQDAYEAVDRDGNDVREYAQRFVSTPGKKDGLWWEDERHMSPFGLQVGDFLDDIAKNPDPDKTVWGYRWKMLKGQGAKAPGGAYSYVINGHQVSGFAFVATPAAYRKTGVMTFIVNKNGRIFEKDLGEQGLDAVKAMELYEPDDTWDLCEREAPEEDAPPAPEGDKGPEKKDGGK